MCTVRVRGEPTDMAHETETRRLELGMAEFASSALTEQAARYGVAEEQLVKQAVRHWQRVSATDRASARVPRFAQPRRAAPATRVRVELDSTDWQELERSADDQGVRLEQLLVHVIVLFLADLDSGRATAEMALEDEEGG